MLNRQHFIEKIEAFINKKQISATCFGTDALNDPNFVSDMRKGNRSPTLATIDKVQKFMREYPKHHGGANP